MSAAAPDTEVVAADIPVISGAVANQAVNDNATISPFASVTVSDSDTQDMFARVTINNGVARGDFTAASTAGWTRTVVGNNILYEQYYPVQANIGSVVQADIQAFVFQPRTNAITPNTTETTAFTIYVTDGQTSATNTTTSVVTTSVNNVPLLGGAVANQSVNDSATVAPFSTLTVADPDTQDLFARVTINNGVVRGDFTAASTTGWTRIVSGNNIIYQRYFNPSADIGATAQASIRAFVFQPRTNAIEPNTTEATAFTVYVTDGLATATNTTTSVITTSVNNVPLISGAIANQTVNDNATVAPFSTLTVADPDTQDLFARVTINNGVARGDFTAASTAGWTRIVSGNNIIYQRYFSPGTNIGATVQASIQAFVFQPRTNAIEPNTTEATAFTVYVTDGIATATNTTTSVVTTSVNDVPVIGGAVANQQINSNTTVTAFSTLTVTDPDTEDMLLRVTIANGTNRGDFTTASTVGWTRSVVGTDIVYARYFANAANIGASAQAAVRTLNFQPRVNIPVNSSESTTFTVFAKDGSGATTTDSTTSVITTGVPAGMIADSDTTTIVLPTAKKAKTTSVV